MTWFGLFINVMLTNPLLYPGYLMPEEKQTLATPTIGMSISWIVLFVCVFVLILVFALFLADARFHRSQKIDN